jgi:FkbM family methyltransferase
MEEIGNRQPVVGTALHTKNMIKKILKTFVPTRVKEEVRKAWKEFEIEMPRYEQENLVASFSAWGEDRIIKSWLDLKGVDPREVRYLDIGAAYPVFLSNTYLLYKNGGSGVLVEPDPKSVARLKEVRTRDTVLDVGVAAKSGSGKLLLLTASVFNTFSVEAAEKDVSQSRDWKEDQRQDIVGTVDVKLVTINEILEAQFAAGPLHVLSIDVEGMDFAVLSGMDFQRFAPLVICTEIGAGRAVYEGILSPFGYQFVCWTPDNYIFVKM